MTDPVDTAIDIGFVETLPVVAVYDDGVELGDDAVWLPKRELDASPAVGDEIQVFVGSDRDGHPLATTRIPLAEVGQFAFLEVVDLAPHGAYLHWGLDRDLFVPNFLQFDEPRVGSRLMVAIDVDEKGRLFGSNRLVDYFDPDTSDLSEGQEVTLWVFGRNDLGWLVIVDDAYAGLLYADQVFQPLQTGQRLTGWVQELRDDGKVDVRLRRTGRRAIDDDRDTLWAALLDADGFLPLTDRSPPAQIRERLQMSKKAFKRALGGLYKEGRVHLGDDGVWTITEGEE